MACGATALRERRSSSESDSCFRFLGFFSFLLFFSFPMVPSQRGGKGRGKGKEGDPKCCTVVSPLVSISHITIGRTTMSFVWSSVWGSGTGESADSDSSGIDPAPAPPQAPGPTRLPRPEAKVFFRSIVEAALGVHRPAAVEKADRVVVVHIPGIR